MTHMLGEAARHLADLFAMPLAQLAVSVGWKWWTGGA